VSATWATKRLGHCIRPPAPPVASAVSDVSRLGVVQVQLAVEMAGAAGIRLKCLCRLGKGYEPHDPLDLSVAEVQRLELNPAVKERVRLVLEHLLGVVLRPRDGGHDPDPFTRSGVLAERVTCPPISGPV